MAEPFRPPNLALSTIGLSLATFMQVLDTTIANVSLPTIAGNLGVSNDQSTWVITSFAVSMAISLPLTGFLTRRFGEVKLFVWSTLLFALISFLCGISQSMGMLIVFRAIQGAVAGPMYPITQSMLIGIYPPEKRGMALALLAMVTVVAPIAGPILGGLITDNYSWPWIFFINVPIGIFASMVVANQIKGRIEKLQRPKIDYVGLVTLIIGIGALQIVLDKGNDEDWFNSSFIVITAIISAIAIAIFLIWELTDKDPIVDLRLFRHRNFRYGTIALIGHGRRFSQPWVVARMTEVLLETLDKKPRVPQKCYHVPIVSKDGLTPTGTRSGITFELVVLQPRSRGSVRLADSDPTSMPLIDPNFMADEYDLSTAIKSIRSMREVMKQPSLEPLLDGEIVPGAALQTDQELGDWIKRTVTTMWHPVGTCRMGKDDRAVVDAQLRVNGVRNLRVIDASIMPNIISGNTNAPTQALARHGAELFLNSQA
ncbi:MAG: hypothetical protein WDW38_001165 [Sanguina aurantia]